jgi:sulfopyruvate decarboxylase TPP-binding subunit
VHGAKEWCNLDVGFLVLLVLPASMIEEEQVNIAAGLNHCGKRLALHMQTAAMLKTSSNNIYQLGQRIEV